MRLLASANLTILYLVWGSTYLAISVMVRTIPPLFGMGVRFVVAGAIIYAVLGFPKVLAAQLRGAATTGALLLGAAYGLLAVAQQTVPSGLAAAVIASVPLWVIPLRALHRAKVPGVAQIGLLVGFAGVLLLVLPSGVAGPVAAVGLVLLVGAAMAEAVGAFYTPRLPHPPAVLTTAAVQMLVAGVLLVVAAIVAGEQLRLGDWSAESLVGLAYLIGPGSLLAYVSLVWLLDNVPVWLATTYAYVNPAVALFLGWLVLDEPLPATTVIGSGLVILSVIVVTVADRRF